MWQGNIRSKIIVWFQGRGRGFSFPESVQTGDAATNLLLGGYQGGLSPGMKRPQRDVNNISI